SPATAATMASQCQAPWHVSCHVSRVGSATAAQEGGGDVTGHNTPHFAFGQAVEHGHLFTFNEELSWSRDLSRFYWWVLRWVSVCNMGWKHSTRHRVLSK